VKRRHLQVAMHLGRGAVEQPLPVERSEADAGGVLEVDEVADGEHAHAKIALIVKAIESPIASPMPVKSPFRNRLPPDAASKSPAFVTVPAPVAVRVPVTW
jgi:hypothetical protein